jgi:UDP-glucose 4-epimerase
MLYLITGGAGFVGSNLAEELLRIGHGVRIIDNLSTGKKENIQPGAEFFELDFTNLEAIRPAFEGVDGVFHVGALPRVPFSIEQPIASSEANIFGTLNVLVAARDAGVKRVVYSASSSAYGGSPDMPYTPEMKVNLLSPYAVQKYVGELFAEQFARLYGMETVSLRYFNVYGPRMADEGAYATVISIFARQRKNGQPLTIAGDGEQTRDMTHVSDVVNANILSMQSQKVGKGEVLNVGTGTRHSINKIAGIVGGETTYIPSRLGDPLDSLADISLTKELLGWEPKIQFDNGLRDTLRLLGVEPAK